MTEQDRIIYEQDKLIAKMKTDLDIVTRQRDELAEWIRDEGCCPGQDSKCGDNSCWDCISIYILKLYDRIKNQ